MTSQMFGLLMDIALGAAAFRLAWSVDRSQKSLVKVIEQQAALMRELGGRVERLEDKTKWIGE